MLMSESEHEKITYLQWAADPRSGLPEEKRREAVNEFLALLRTQVSEYRQGKRGAVSRLLQQAVTGFALPIFADPDPLSAMDHFLRGKRKRGKRAVNADRDFRIAVQVAHKMKTEGMSLDDACAFVAELGKKERKFKLTSDRIENIYKARSAEAKAQAAMQMLEANTVSAPSGSPRDAGSS
jgi:hypothetical protein